MTLVVKPDDLRWLDEIEAQLDDTVPLYVPRLIAEIRQLRRALEQAKYAKTWDDIDAIFGA